MIRYVPPFILQNYEQNQFRGSIDAYIIFFDIADFTPTGTALQKNGKKGAEELSGFLEVALGVPIEIVLESGGFVSSFAGDAFYAIFPEENGDGMLQVTQKIHKYFIEHRIHHTPFGDFGIKVRQAICFGKIDWQIFINEYQNEYVFSGEPVLELGELAALKRDIILSEKAMQKAGMQFFLPTDASYIFSELPDTKPKPLEFIYKPESADRFLHSLFQGDEPQNEIRMAAYCFLNLSAIKEDQLDKAIHHIHKLADGYGAFVNKCIATEFGLMALVLFGIPKVLDRTLDRACRFAIEIRNQLPDIALGISSGSGFAGFTGRGQISEYTALSHPVNLAARLMMKALPGQIISDQSIYLEQHAAYEFSEIGKIALKGIDTPLPHYLLKKQIYKAQQFRNCSFVGRDTEVQVIKSTIDAGLCSRSNPLIYVMGDAGVGKSRLVNEVLMDYPDSDYQKFYIYCDALIQKPLEAIKQIVLAYFMISSEQNSQDCLKAFQSAWQSFAADDPEMIRIESIIASIIGLTWEGSIWDMLPSEEKMDQLQKAFIYFIENISRKKPILMHLDDGQWLDSRSIWLLQLLSNSGISPIVIICACRYLEQGEYPDLMLEKHEKSVIDLSVLDEPGSTQLIYSLFDLNTIPDETKDLICRKASGNPFFIEQLVDYLIENQIVDQHANLIKEVDYLESFGISDIVGSRIDKLTANLRELVSGASILGMEFNIRVLSRMLNHDLEEGLKSVAQNRIWRDLDEIRYIFSHILIKDVVYQRMLNDKISKLHLTAAEAMEAVFEDDLKEHAEEIAIHYHNANQLLKASDYYDMAGRYYVEKFCYDLGERYYTKAVLIKEEVLGKDAPELSYVINHLASLLEAIGDFERAEPLYQRSIDIRIKAFGEDSPQAAEVLCNLGSLYVNLGKYSEAENLIRKALDTLEKQEIPDHGEIVTALSNLATLSFYQGKAQESEELFLKALKIADSIDGKPHHEVVSIASNLGVIYMMQGKLDKSKPMLDRALDAQKANAGCETPRTAEAINNLASWHSYKAEHECALQLYKQALDMYVKVYNIHHPLVAITMSNIATVQSVLGLYEEAEAAFLKVIEVKEKIYGPDHLDTSVTYNNLAYMYESQERFAEAEVYYEKSLAIKEKSLGTEHPDTALALNNLGTLNMAKDQLEKAEELYFRAIAIADKVLGDEQQITASIVFNIGRLFRRKKDYKQAETYLRRAYKIRMQLLGDAHPHTIKTADEIADFEREIGETLTNTDS